MVYSLAASTLTVVAPIGCDTSSAEDVEPTAAGMDGPSRVLATGADEEMLVLEVTTANKVVVRLPRVEVGQGITTAVAMMIAEELDARLADVDIPLAEARAKGNQYTGGSNSVSSLYGPARALAATARARLVTAAARRWHLPARSLRTRDTMVVAPDGRTATFGSLTAGAARIHRPDVSSKPKPASQHKVIGRPTGRIDARDIVTGKAKYAGDLEVAGAKPTVVARPPTLGGRLVSVDDRAARAMPGVHAVVKVGGGVAVVAESFHHAFKARDALRITWAPGPMASLSDAAIRSRLRAAVPSLGAAPRGSAQVEFEFEFAFVSHAPMEVLTAVADVRADRAEIWFSSQTPMDARESIASAIGLPKSKVRVNVVRGGGSFGRRLNYDAAIEAALISKAARRPVKLMWSRGDDIRHGRMRPASHHRIRASHAQGRVVAFGHAMASVSESYVQQGLAAQGGVSTVAAGPLPSDSGLYNFGRVSGDSGSVELAMPLGAWRSVDSGTMRAAEEIVVDEVAARLGKDPVAFRRGTLRSKAVKAVLDKVATAGSWGRRLPPGHAQGVAVHEEYGSCVACLVEIDATDPKNPRVTKVVMAADVGTAVNPRGLEAQLMGTAVDGISTVLRAGLHIDRGAVREGSFADFRYARQQHSPLRFEAHIMPSRREPGGAGELGVPAAAGAVANAYARATRTKPRRFPINF
ncbi:molybdopterin-dependent oxidoreductase [Streptomyces sp. NBC_01340]|uniref:xanthine dehydrogenase family protein molybdopterin-binding subunit n=1 Tax=unclassified Streptomyces TaxID=2593676 RepID=UPI00225C3017|nr:MULTISPECIES: molybdopterin cofactor-binding domain-containing protein [unclassified Streptomyces]MCX4461946.1 molybdopterin-dependent oxidoreductase [Streptomyces sp. NBC_01719]MCX4490854.1 molybdopterin-dependent oxidoreductase [Streptomyces sp. NBC_01728]WSI43959.1 molybdopterin-dependent oxidoreductase [Streptomyces sp. NBC_01340]